MSALERNPADFNGQRFDVAIIGGGITGAGIARHAALAGLSTLLIEANDFASGTSSRSTKLIHGGLRYLAMGDVALVREGALERKSLKTMAPHLTQPEWMVVPTRSRLEMLKVRTGVSIYEMLGAVDPAERHQNWSRKELETEEPLLDRDRLPYACAYREYLTDDARLVIATLRSAAAAGAVVCNYARLVSYAETGSAVELTIDDVLSGERLTARAAVLVNAAGPWVEAVQAAANTKANGGASSRLYLSKGVHIALPREQLPLKHMLMMTAADKRPVFAIPRGLVTYVGTTDTTVQGGPDYWPRVTSEDVEYLLEPLRTHLSGPDLRSADVVGSWAGMRPLIREAGKAPKEMSRKDEIWVRGRVVAIAGGKLTGYRKMAEQVLARVGQLLGRDVSLEDPLALLPGGEVADLSALRAELTRHYGVNERLAMRLARLYGSEAATVLGTEPTALSAGVFAEEIHWAVRQESALMLEDVVYRRLRIPWFRPQESQAVAMAAAGIMAGLLDWSDAQMDRQLAVIRDRLSDDLSFRSEVVNR